VVNGQWTIEGGAARGVFGREAGDRRDAPEFAATIAAREPMSENVEISYDAWSPNAIWLETKMTSTSGEECLIASHIGRTGGNHNRGEKGFAIIVRAVGSDFQEVSRKRDELAFSADRRYRIRTIRNEGRWRMFVDDTLVLEAEVPDGLVTKVLQLHGVHGERGDVLYIDNVKVRTPAVE
jgi:hypothetical protein